MRVFIIFLLFLLANSTCHYSCKICALNLYSSCQTCANNQNVYILEDPNTLPQQYWTSIYPTGACVGYQNPVNVFGIILLILCVAGCMVFRTKEIFYLFITFQTFGLFSLVEIAWVDSIGYIVQGFQFLMIFNVIGSRYKVDDYVFTISKNYRIKSLLVSAGLGNNIALLAPFTLLALIFLIVLLVIQFLRNKEKQQNKDKVIFQTLQDLSQANRGIENKQQQKCKCRKMSDQTIEILIKFLICFLFLMIQETALVLLVALIYSGSLTGAIIISIIYLNIVLFLVSCAYYHPIDYFQSKKVMYIAFAKKIILPIFVVVPIRYQFLLFLFMGLFIALQIGVDIYEKKVYKGINRIAIYKGFEYVSFVMFTVYYVIQTSQIGLSASKTVGIAATFIVAMFLVCFGVEIPFGIKQAFFSKKKKKSATLDQKLNKLKQQDTLNNVEEIEVQRNDMIEILQISEVNDADSQPVKKVQNSIKKSQLSSKKRQQSIKIAQQEKRRAEELKRKEQEEKKRVQIERKKEEERKRIQASKNRIEEEKRKAYQQKRRLSEERKKAEEKKRISEQRKRAQEQIRAQEQKRRQQEQRKKVEQQRKRAEQQRKIAEQKKRVSEQRKKAQEKIRAQEQKRREKQQKKRAEEEAQKKRFEEQQNEEAKKAEQLAKRKRKQKLDKELRLRYGI